MTDPTTPPPGPEDDDPRALAAEYALGLLTGEERAAFEARLETDPELRTEVVSWQEHLAELAFEDVAEETPSRQVKTRLDAALFASREPSFWHQIWPYGLGGIAAALVLWAAITFGVITPDETPLRADLVAELAPTPEGGDLALRASVDITRAAVQVMRTAGTPPEGRVFELWLIAGDAAPVSLGLLDDSGNTIIDLSDDVLALLPGALLAISDEPPGGSPTGAPTGAVRAAGPLTAS